MSARLSTPKSPSRLSGSKPILRLLPPTPPQTATTDQTGKLTSPQSKDGGGQTIRGWQQVLKYPPVQWPWREKPSAPVKHLFPSSLEELHALQRPETKDKVRMLAYMKSYYNIPKMTSSWQPSLASFPGFPPLRSFTTTSDVSVEMTTKEVVHALENLLEIPREILSKYYEQIALRPLTKVTEKRSPPRRQVPSPQQIIGTDVRASSESAMDICRSSTSPLPSNSLPAVVSDLEAAFKQLAISDDDTDDPMMINLETAITQLKIEQNSCDPSTVSGLESAVHQLAHRPKSCPFSVLSAMGMAIAKLKENHAVGLGGCRPVSPGFAKPESPFTFGPIVSIEGSSEEPKAAAREDIYRVGAVPVQSGLDHVIFEAAITPKRPHSQ